MTTDDTPDIEAMLAAAAQRAIDSVADKPIPAEFSHILGGGPQRDRRRLRRYGILAVVATAAVALFFALRPDGSTSTTDTAAPPASGEPVTTSEPEQITVDAQIEIDTATAAELGLVIGQIVLDEDGTVAPADEQPDLVPIVDADGTLLGYSPPDAALAPDGEAFPVYGPDGTTVRGEFDAVAGFTPAE